MNLTSTQLATLFGAIVVVLLIVGVVYVWYAITLSKVFRTLGAEGWRAWVPILNEAELLRLGGVPAWSVIFYAIPIVGFYGLYLKATALSRINAHFGRGAGSTVLGILLPPVWATLLGAAGSTPDRALQERIATSVEPRSGYAFAVSTPQQPPTSQRSAEPPAQPASTGLTPPPVAPSAPPVLPPPPLGMPTPPPPTEPAAPPPPPVAPPTAAPSTAPQPEAAALVSAPPPAPSTIQIVPPPSLIPPPPVVVTPTLPLPPTAPEMPSQPWAPMGPGPAPTAQAIDDVEDAVADGDENLDRTVVVDRRPVVPWRLVVEGGPTFRLSGSTVVLGRKPAGSGAGAQEIAVPDPTRTLSKVHARLDLADGGWTVTDLNATNGVIVIGADGSETLLDPGASAAVHDSFVLGKVAMKLTFGDAAAGS